MSAIPGGADALSAVAEADGRAPTSGAAGPTVALVVPSSPMVLPEYVGRQDPFGAIRGRCVGELAGLLAAGQVDRVVIVTAADPVARHHRQPLGIRIGRELLARAGWAGVVTPVAVPADAGGGAIAEAVNGIRQSGEGLLLLVVADGSAKRTEKAPGHFDDRAAALDADLLRALAEGDGAALGALDPQLCQELWLTGRAAFAVLAGVVGDAPVAAEVLWADDPYGVQYVLARWRAGAAASS